MNKVSTKRICSDIVRTLDQVQRKQFVGFCNSLGDSLVHAVEDLLEVDVEAHSTINQFANTLSEA